MEHLQVENYKGRLMNDIRTPYSKYISKGSLSAALIILSIC